VCGRVCVALLALLSVWGSMCWAAGIARCGECVCCAPGIADLDLLGDEWPVDAPVALPARSVYLLTELEAR